eukprot:COSAG06_NODE_2986_length_5985_cov_9.841828_1_plen_104_part_00
MRCLGVTALSVPTLSFRVVEENPSVASVAIEDVCLCLCLSVALSLARVGSTDPQTCGDQHSHITSVRRLGDARRYSEPCRGADATVSSIRDRVYIMDMSISVS